MHDSLQAALFKGPICVLFTCRKSAKLDWMYQGGMVAKAEANKRVEEQQQAAQPVQPPQPSNVRLLCAACPLLLLFSLASCHWHRHLCCVAL